MFTFLIPYRKRPGQYKRLSRALESVARLPLVDEIVISEYGIHDPAIDTLRAVVVTEHCEGIWNRSRCLNHGLKCCRGPFVVVLDADCVPDPRLTVRLKRLHRRWPAVILHVTTGGCLNTHGSGNVGVALDLIRQVGGYDEVFEGYGREDKDLELRLQPNVAYLGHMVADDEVSDELTDRDMEAWDQNAAYFARKHGSVAIRTFPPGRTAGGSPHSDTRWHGSGNRVVGI